MLTDLLSPNVFSTFPVIRYFQRFLEFATGSIRMRTTWKWAGRIIGKISRIYAISCYHRKIGAIYNNYNVGSNNESCGTPLGQK